MPHIELSNDLPGIRGLAAYRPETGRSLYELAEALLCSESTLSRAERELIGAYVSSRNECAFCTGSHAAASRQLFGDDASVVDSVLRDVTEAPISAKLKALLVIAGKVQRDGKSVLEADVAEARRFGATDREIHDTVLIAAAFSMFNRYVDGLATRAPADPEAYREMGQMMAERGYARRLSQIINA
ncbi:MAG TPA: peroxidase-related enzyme [Rhodothermales bacterium]|nr:peroxidase-related enzyme [Rhodothermales bacterium]